MQTEFKFIAEASMPEIPKFRRETIYHLSKFCNTTQLCEIVGKNQISREECKRLRELADKFLILKKSAMQEAM